MKKSACIFIITLCFLMNGGLSLHAAPLIQQSQGTCVISSPAAGTTVRGQTSVTGTVQHAKFTGYQIGYAPDPNPSGEWKFFANGQTQVTNGPLGTWDTTKLPDGVYQLIMEVFRNDGNKDLCFVSKISVNNTAPTATFTALPLPTAADTPTPLATAAVTSTAASTITPTTSLQQPTFTPRPTPTYSSVNNPTPTPEMTKFKLPIDVGGISDWSCRGAQATIVIAVIVASYFVIRNMVASGVRKVSQSKDVDGFHRRRPRQY